MNKTLTNALMFVAGAAIGSFTTYKLLKTTYEQKIHDEIEEMERYYSNKETKIVEDSTEEISNEESAPTESLEALDSLIVKEGYINYSDIKTKKGGGSVKKPYIITSKEFDTLDDYDAETLTYHSNDVLVDDANRPIEDVEGMVGTEFKTRFGEDENDRDSVFVRNEARMTDYEILYDAEEYEDDSSAYTVDDE